MWVPLVRKKIEEGKEEGKGVLGLGRLAGRGCALTGGGGVCGRSLAGPTQPGLSGGEIFFSFLFSYLTILKTILKTILGL
jgi:hypothetical protein